jgi:hypothetical protein
MFSVDSVESSWECHSQIGDCCISARVSLANGFMMTTVGASEA